MTGDELGDLHLTGDELGDLMTELGDKVDDVTLIRESLDDESDRSLLCGHKKNHKNTHSL